MALVRATPQFLVGTGGVPELGFEFGGSKVPLVMSRTIAQTSIPLVIMPGDGTANGCQFTGTNGAFTLSAAILTNTGGLLAGCYAYFSANFGGSSLPAGWYWTKFSSDTAGRVYAETYTTGLPSRPAAETEITPNLSGWVTGTTIETVGIPEIILTETALGKNGRLVLALHVSGSTTGTKTFRFRDVATTAQIFNFGSTTSPVCDSLMELVCFDSHTIKAYHRSFGNVQATSYGAPFSTVDTSVGRVLQVSLQQSTGLCAPILAAFSLTAVYGA